MGFNMRRLGVGAMAIITGIAGLGALAGGPAASAEPGSTSASSVDCGKTEAADPAAAGRLAGACGRSIEDLSARTEYQQVLVNPSGTRTLRASVVPQRVRRPNGSWATIDPNLRPAAGGLAPVASAADLTFSAGGSGPLVTWRESGSTFTLAWPLGALPAPEVHGGTATYRNVLPDVNLHVTATADGYTHVVELLSARAAANPAVRSLRYRTGGDMRVVPNGAGKIRLVAASGAVVATSTPATMWDSSDDPARAGEVLPAVAAARAAGRVQPGERSTAVEPAVTARTASVNTRR